MSLRPPTPSDGHRQTRCAFGDSCRYPRLLGELPARGRKGGRDREAARCVLLYSIDDVERQFGMSARSRLSHRDIVAILKSLRRLGSKKRQGDEIVATAGEILAEEEEGLFGGILRRTIPG